MAAGRLEITVFLKSGSKKVTQGYWGRLWLILMMKLMKKAQNHIKRFPPIIRYQFMIEVAILGTGLVLDLMVTRWLRITNTPRYLTREPRRQEQRLILKGNRNLEGDDGSFLATTWHPHKFTWVQINTLVCSNNIGKDYERTMFD